MISPGRLWWLLKRDLKRGLSATIAWYRDNEWWWAPLKERVEAGYAKRGQ